MVSFADSLDCVGIIARNVEVVQRVFSELHLSSNAHLRFNPI